MVSRICVRPSSNSEICKRLFRCERLFAESMVVYAVDMGRRIMVLRGTVLPMYVSHAPSNSWCNGLNGMDQPRSRQGRLFTPWALQSSRVR
ncbi:hypothetical protein pRL120438 [Rhizobium johnstonii 3841]|uniref:Uncharacterized protein n=1 Tax=Rhizobium johnstonii (strain DSM 114642 / LMG 32736 / 3841) TaxID=216596 RepID=Q1M426_RHIJ3|nr:hypothetical protein pRL120438 [Rhizobium johnstonii 3841]